MNRGNWLCFHVLPHRWSGSSGNGSSKSGGKVSSSGVMTLVVVVIVVNGSGSKMVIAVAMLLKVPTASYSSSINNSPTSKTLPTRDVERDLRTSNSLRLQTTVTTVCPRIHHPATQLPEAYLIVIKPLSCGSCGIKT